MAVFSATMTQNGHFAAKSGVLAKELLIFSATMRLLRFGTASGQVWGKCGENLI